MSQSSKPTPIALPNELSARIEDAAKRLGMSKSEVMRITMAVGLEHLARINYDLPSAILDAPSKPLPATPKRTNIVRLNEHIIKEDRAAEEPGDYKA